MDPISQGALGSVFALTKARKNHIFAAIWLGALSGMAPDLDILIRSNSDPMMYFEYHRHFTHSFVFIPFGALICAAVLSPFFKKLFKQWPPLSFKSSYLYCFLGFASHGVLDACTSYGTQLLWPFSSIRVAWDIVSIVDPLFTLPILAMIILARIKKNTNWGKAALGYALLFMSVGVFQHQRAIKALNELASDRGHTPVRVHAKPSIANLILFRGIYEYNNRFYADAIRVPFTGGVQAFEGSSKARVFPEEIYPSKTSIGYQDLKKFEWFSDNFLVASNDDPYLINDFRYALLPNSSQELWGVLCNPNSPNKHVAVIHQRNIDKGSGDAPGTLDVFWSMLSGEGTLD